MSEAATPLPEDLTVCHGMIRELAASLRAAQRQLEQLGHRLDLLLRRLYGPRSERVDPGQLLLFGDQAEEPTSVVAPGTELPHDPPAPGRACPVKGHGRRALPASLPRERRVYGIPADQLTRPGCGRDRTPIGEETSEQLDYRPASLFIVEHVRVTDSSPANETRSRRNG
jgi:transposase